MVSSLDVAQFARDGYLVVPEVFSREETERLCAAVDAALVRRADPPPPMAERDAYDRMFTQHYNLWEDSPEVRAYTFAPRLAAIASALLGAPKLRIYCDQSFYKEPGSDETGVHQDYRLLSIAETRTITAWISLNGSTREAGALGYLPGSHLHGRATNLDISRGDDPLHKPELQALLAEPAFHELSPGSVAFHHVLTFHLATANRSQRTRKAFAVTFFADGSTRGTAWPHASVDREGIAVGERIEGLGTPVVWPPSPELPPPPPPYRSAPKGWPGRAGGACDPPPTCESIVRDSGERAPHE
ncbi:phytanoyl-CoA dioxygenase family protein [Nannocystis pusilla]|uniref:phytanoyl-CoA dioxygenase family protein n=1 Tax=Nannocystis pusilla TaxID=889268 RepID=UPI003DA26C94